MGKARTNYRPGEPSKGFSLRLRRHKNQSDPVSVVNRFVDAANRHDAEGIAKCLHPEFESIQPIYPARNFRGAGQVRRNWQAIFESEPGFRLSLVRAANADNTVWVELHGAGADVEVAGVFIMGVEGDLVRWARVYSSVVEQIGPRAAAPDPETPVAVEDQAGSLAEEAARLREQVEAGRRPLTVVEDEADVVADGEPAGRRYGRRRCWAAAAECRGGGRGRPLGRGRGRRRRRRGR